MSTQTQTKPAVQATKSNKPSTRGRPLGESRSDVRGCLLDAATTLFASQGVGATRLTQIAACAGVTSAMVHYYFKNRKQLIDAVVEERLLCFINHVWQPVSMDNNDVFDMASALVQKIVEGIELMPWMPAIWLREVISSEGCLRDKLLSRIPTAKMDHLRRCCLEAQKKGLVNATIEPRFLFMSLLGLTMLPLAVASEWHRLPGTVELTPEVLTRHVLALLHHGLSPTAPAFESGEHGSGKTKAEKKAGAAQ